VHDDHLPLDHGPARPDERGASLVEYSLVLAFIAIACVLALSFLGSQTSTGIRTNTSSMFVNP